MTPGVALQTTLPDPAFTQAWDAIKIAEQVRTRLISQSMLALTVRPKVPFEVAPLHGLIVLAGEPGTGKTTLARGLAGKVAGMLPGQKVTFLQVDPHALASAALGKSSSNRPSRRRAWAASPSFCLTRLNPSPPTGGA